jgi:hypothetical protein
MVTPEAELREIFRQYTEAKRELSVVTGRCLLKGWPDRKTAVQDLAKTTSLVMEYEALRFEHLLSDVAVEGPVWKSLGAVLDRVFQRLEGH